LLALTSQPAPLGVRETPTAVPTLDVTPTFITAEAPTIIAVVITPPTQESLPPQPGGDASQPTPTPPLPTLAPTVFIEPNEIPPTVSLDSLVAPPLPQDVPPSLLTFAITTTGGGGVASTTFSSGNVSNTVLFEQNPVNGGEYALVNTVGQLYVGGLGSAPGVAGDPFTEFTYQVFSRDENDAAVGDISYAPNGTLAFVINAGKQNKDGIWVLQGGPRQILRDCPFEGHPGCLTVQGQRNASTWISDELRWSGNGQQLIVELRLPSEGRRGFILLDVNSANPEVLPQVYRYDSAHWSQDNNRVLVSGIGPDGQAVIGWLNATGGEVQVFFNGSSAGVYPRQAVEQPGGRVVAFGSDFGGGPVWLIDGFGTRLSDNIGGAPPARIEWSPDRSAAVVQTVDGRTYVVNANNGAIQDITGQAGSLAVGFVPGSLPPPVNNAAPPQSSIPSGVVEGSRYQPGQQLQVAAVGGLNVREQPSTAAAVVSGVLPGEYVAVLAGPVEAEGFEWWQIKTATDARGWIAGTINGFDTLIVP
jgi:hypothetical protein